MSGHVSGIYIIVNTKNGKVYVGQSSNLTLRFAYHRSRLKCGKHYNPHLQSAWNKYGEKAFKFLKLEYCPVEQLDEREQHYIDIYWSKAMCYNLTNDVIAPLRGRSLMCRNETRLKISEKAKGRVFSDEARQKMSAASKGHKRGLGSKRTEESRKRMGEAQKRRHARLRGELNDTE